MADARIRISVSRVLGELFLRRAMAPLATRFPHLVVDLVSSPPVPGVSREPEIALRLGPNQELRLIVRPDVARLARVGAVVDHLAALFQDRMPGSEAA
jgi:DNA-binding transcriptional LysR family regulator